MKLSLAKIASTVRSLCTIRLHKQNVLFLHDKLRMVTCEGILLQPLSTYNHILSWHFSTAFSIPHTRGGTGMKNQILVGYRVPKKNQVRVKSVLGSRKTRPENTCITSEVIHRHKGQEYVSSTTPNFPWPQNFSAFLSCVELQINQYCL